MGTDTLKPGSGNDLALAEDGGAAALTVEQDSDVKIETGNLIIGTSGKGINFEDTGGTTRVLDDYETGIWTPVVQTGPYGSPTTITFTGGTQTFTYVKIGQLCQVYFSIAAATSSAPSGSECRVTGLPFTSIL